MKKNHIDLGRRGEELARRHLLLQNMSILTSNYTFRKGEIDVIAMDGQELVFVEVKTRNSNYFGEPYQAVNRTKQRQIIKVANQFIQERKLNYDVRFDIISIVINNHQTKVQHIKNAFTPFV